MPKWECLRCGGKFEGWAGFHKPCPSCGARMEHIGGVSSSLGSIAELTDFVEKTPCHA